MLWHLCKLRLSQGRSPDDDNSGNWIDVMLFPPYEPGIFAIGRYKIQNTSTAWRVGLWDAGNRLDFVQTDTFTGTGSNHDTTDETSAAITLFNARSTPHGFEPPGGTSAWGVGIVRIASAAFFGPGPIEWMWMGNTLKVDD